MKRTLNDHRGGIKFDLKCNTMSMRYLRIISTTLYFNILYFYYFFNILYF